MSGDKKIRFQVECDPGIAWELAMFLKRTTYDQAYELTESWRSPDERERLAYMKVHGLEAVREGLEKVGYAPR